MEKSKFNQSSSKRNTRTIGVNTDTNCWRNGKCIKCFQENHPKFPFYPCYVPFPFPFCNCMMSFMQNNIMNSFNFCQCENFYNMYNCHQCSSSSSDCSYKCSTYAVANNNSTNISQTCENCHEVIEKNEDKLKTTVRSSRNILKEESSKDEEQHYDVEDEISREDITKYANEYLEKSYRSRYEPKQKVEDTINKEENKDRKQSNADNRHLLNHLLKPNATNHSNNKLHDEDSDDFTEDNDETIFEDDELEVKTVIRSSEYGKNKEDNEQEEEKESTKISIKSKRSQISSQNDCNETSKEQMLMMLTALVSSQYANNNTSHLNKLINHIGTEQRSQKSDSKIKSPSRCPTPSSNNSSPRRRVSHRYYSNIISRSNENKKI